MAENRVSDQWLGAILRALYQQRTATRADLMEATQLNAGSVSLALQRLLQSATILKVGGLDSESGRRKDFLTLNPDAAYFIGVDLESRRIRFALTNFLGDIRYRCDEDIESDQRLDIHKLFNGIERVTGTLNAAHLSRVLAAGISYPGLMDHDGRLTAVNLGWRKFPLVAELESIGKLRNFTSFPIFLESDRHSCVLVEQWLGRAQQYSNGIHVSCERGIGVGLFLDGRVIEGWRDMAGELGHLTIEPDSEERCNCGKRGCLESIATSDNVVRQYRQITGQTEESGAKLRFTDVLERARQNDVAAVKVMDRVGRAWGLALSHVVNLLNPQVIILGGDLITGSDVLLPRIKAELSRHCLPELVDGLDIAMSTLGLDIRLRAAASLAFRKCLADPGLLKKMCSSMLLSGRALNSLEDQPLEAVG